MIPTFSSLDEGFDDMMYNFCLGESIPTEYVGYRMLWVGVIKQWYDDLHSRDEEVIRECKRWPKTKDCQEVCDNASIDFRLIVQVIRNYHKREKINAGL